MSSNTGGPPADLAELTAAAAGRIARDYHAASYQRMRWRAIASALHGLEPWLSREPNAAVGRWYRLEAKAFEAAVLLLRLMMKDEVPSRQRVAGEVARFEALWSMARAARVHAAETGLLERWPEHRAIWADCFSGKKMAEVVVDVVNVVADVLTEGGNRLREVEPALLTDDAWFEGFWQRFTADLRAEVPVAETWHEDADAVRDERLALSEFGPEYEGWKARRVADPERAEKGTEPAPPPVGDTGRVVLALLRTLPAERALTGSELIAALGVHGFHVDQSTLTSRIIPELKAHGVRNRRGIGYFIRE